MSFLSNRLIFLFYKYIALALSFLFLFFLMESIYKNGIDHKLFGLFILFLFAFAFAMIFVSVKNLLIEVEISNKHIIITGKNEIIEWTDLSEIDFTWLGLYRMKYGDNVVYFPPYDVPANVFGFRVSTSDFDELIDRKKRELDI